MYNDEDLEKLCLSYYFSFLLQKKIKKNIDKL